MLTDLELAVAEEAAARDARLRSRPADRRGVVHTPPELARYGAVVLDRTLRERLGRVHGLADPAVALVDPACGPGAFLAAALAVARGPGPAVWLGIDRDHAALRAARQRIGDVARARGVPVVLRRADTLASLRPWPHGLPEGATVVVLGNPPWAVGSDDGATADMERLLDDFRRGADGMPLAERRIGVLRDAYVRFWRWAAEVAARSDGGAAVLLVTNASFLDGPVHRGMRGALLRWFDGVDVLDLGGSALVARDRRRDDNVFGVRPAVAVTLAWRCAVRHPAGVRYARMVGARDEKLRALAAADPDRLRWTRLRPAPPEVLLVPARGPAWSAGAVSIAEAMPFHREGVQTNRDRVAVDVDRERLLARLRAFAAGERSADLEAAFLPSRHYDPERAREAVRRALAWEDPRGVVRPLAYRPFDVRWFAPIAPLCHRPRPALLRAVDRSEAVLLTVRKDRGQRPWAHFGAVRQVPDNCWTSTRSSCRTRAFPTHGPDGSPNLDAAVAQRVAERIGAAPPPERFLRYALAVLASRTYRATHDAALRVDYPRLPLPSGPEAFDALVRAGDRLLAAFGADPPAGAAPAEGGHVVGHHRLALGEPVVRALEAADRAYVQGSTPPG
ncbi:MAG: type ISP restriction/modification enzyme [Myxococcota bacterium]